MNYKVFPLLLFLFITLPVCGEPRSFNTLFPHCETAQQEQIFSPGGIIKTAEKTLVLQLIPPALRETNIPNPVLTRNPAFLVESLMVIPSGSTPVDLIKIYNALCQVRNLKGRLYNSFTRGKEVPLFEDATQVIGEKRLDSIPDPPFIANLPQSAALFMKLKDVNFGQTYYRADIKTDPASLTCGISNFRNITFKLFPVIKENKFYAQLYFEPLKEGTLIYCIAGADISNFIASQIDMPSAIRKRLEVIISWVVDGIQD